ncbi:hypothetical protein J0J30_22670, partial [Vibrio vulnificus]|nr:hypothetical protein [Vibrio vulnificus]
KEKWRIAKEKKRRQLEGSDAGGYMPPLPFPQATRKPGKSNEFFQYLDMLKKVQVNIPFLEALTHIPKNAKFLKELVSSKKKLEEFATVPLTEECSAIIQRKLPPKLKDPGSFSVPITIGPLEIDKALCDFGASINLMPLSLYHRLNMRELKSCTNPIQLAD